MRNCLHSRLDPPAWPGLPLGRFEPEARDTPLEVAAAVDTLFFWQTGASPAEVRTGRGSVLYRRLPGVIDLMAAGEEVQIRHVEGASPGQCLVVGIPAGWLPRQRCDDLPGWRLWSRFGIKDTTLLHLAKQLHADCAAGQPQGPLFTEQLSTQLVVHLVLHYARRERKRIQAASSDSRGLNADTLQRIFHHIDAQLHRRELSLSEMASVAGYSVPQFTRLFRASTGVSPYRHVLRRRVQRALRWLEDSTAPLNTVAAACGFAHAAHLCRCVADQVGMPPARYRRHVARWPEALWRRLQDEAPCP